MANLNLISVPTYSDGELDAAVERELRMGFQVETAQAEERNRTAAQEAAEFRKHNRTVKGLGKIAACIDPRDFFRAVNKYGHEEVHSPEFIRSIRKYNPELTINRV